MNGPLQYAVGSIHVRGRADQPSQVSSQPLQYYDVRELWYDIQPCGWVSLAVVSPDRTGKTLQLARSLADMGTQALGRSVELINATDLDLAFVGRITDRLASNDSTRKAGAHQIILALDSPIVNPLAIGVIAACDSALLLLLRGQTTVPDARRTAERIGRERLLGAVIVSE